MLREDLSSLGVFRMRPPEKAATPAFPLGLGQSGVHEIAEASFGDMAAVTGFALAASLQGDGPVIHIQEDRSRANHGVLMDHGLPALRRTVPPRLTVHARRRRDALWSLEEAVESRTAALVIGEIGDLDFTASRRLSLASQRCGVPVILLLPYTREGATAATARWRISSRRSARNRFDPYAPGAMRWHAVLERVRGAQHPTPCSFDLELNDETLSISVVSGLAADPAAPRPSVRTDTAGSWRRTG